MYIVNHFLDIEIAGITIPDNAADEATNAATGVGSIGAQVALCEGLYGRGPVGILVDYFDRGDVFTAQNNAVCTIRVFSLSFLSPLPSIRKCLGSFVGT